MRFVDCTTSRKLVETKSDARGRYQLELPEITKPTTISMDAIKPGYQRLAGTLTSGDGASIEVAPGTVTEAPVKVLQPALYFAGFVVDENGKPVSGVELAADAVSDLALYGIERTATNSDGSFELFNYPAKPISLEDDGKLVVTKGAVSFFHPDYVVHCIRNVYALAHKQRTSLRIVLATGRKIGGTLLDQDGKPVPNVTLKAIQGDGAHRKTAMTDAKGKFVLRGLVDGPTILSGTALNLKRKIRLPMNVHGDQNDLVVRLHSMTLPAHIRTYTVLGMQLTDMTAELRSAYDLDLHSGALILDPGKTSDRLNIGELAEGCCFVAVGDSPIDSVREFVKQILVEAGCQVTGQYSVRVVYTFSTPVFEGTSTQSMSLTKNDIRELQIVMERFAASERATIAELRKAGAQFMLKTTGVVDTGGRNSKVPQIKFVILGKKWKGGDADFRKLSEVATLDGHYILVLGQGRVTDQALEELRKARPRVRIQRLSQESLGVVIDATTQTSGLQINEVFPGSPADQAGIRAGDRILELAGKPVRDMRSIRESLRQHHPGQKFILKMLRDQTPFTITVEFGQWN